MVFIPPLHASERRRDGWENRESRVGKAREEDVPLKNESLKEVTA